MNNKPKKINIKNKKEASKLLSQKTHTQVSKTKKKTVKKTPQVKVTKKPSSNPSKISVPQNTINNIKHTYTEARKEEKKPKETYSPRHFEQDKKETYHPVYKPKTTEKKHEENLGNRIKKSIFEEKEQPVYKTPKKKKNIVKYLGKNGIFIIIGGILIFLALLIIIISLVKGSSKKIIDDYTVYPLGETVYLVDNSKWYVIQDDGASSPYVTLLRDKVLDINGDDIIDENDKLPFSTDGKVTYDTSNEGSAPYYLENTYKKYLEEKVITVKSVALLTSKQYIKVRDALNYGYEWQEGNFLANDTVGIWWIDGVQTEKVYAVGINGSYRLFYPDSKNYVRPTITVKKALIK